VEGLFNLRSLKGGSRVRERACLQQVGEGQENPNSAGRREIKKTSHSEIRLSDRT